MCVLNVRSHSRPSVVSGLMYCIHSIAYQFFPPQTSWEPPIFFQDNLHRLSFVSEYNIIDLMRTSLSFRTWSGTHTYNILYPRHLNCLFFTPDMNAHQIPPSDLLTFYTSCMYTFSLKTGLRCLPCTSRTHPHTS